MIYKNITREEYNKLEGINASRLKAYYEDSLTGNYEDSKPRVETEPMRKGTMTHSLILEPESFNDEYELFPTCPSELWIKQTGKDKGTKYKIKPKAVKEWEENLPKDKKYYTTDLMELVHTMDESVQNDEGCKTILDLCPMRETAVTWIDEITGLKCKALIDGLGKKLAMDLKTTRGIPKRFSTDIEGNHVLDLEATGKAIFWKLLVETKNALQFSFYFDGVVANNLPVEKFGVAFVENDYPCAAHGIILSDERIEYGRGMYRRALDNWKNREDNKSCFNGIMEV